MKNQIKYFALFCLAIISLVFPDKASAYDFEYNGLYYDVISLQDMTCALTKGTEIYNGTIVIPEQVEYSNRKFKVTAIKYGILSKVENLTIPPTIDELEFDETLKNLILQDGKNPLKISGPYWHSYLKTLYLGRNLLFDLNPFQSKEIEEVTIGPFIKTIPNNLFSGNKKLSTVRFTGLPKTIGEKAFYECNISTLKLPNSVESIGNSAFENNSQLEKIILSDSLKSIGSRAFMGCSHITDIVLPPNLESIETGTFNGCPIKNIVIPKNIKIIKSYGFYPISTISFDDTDQSISLSFAEISADSVYMGRNFTGNIKADKVCLGTMVTILNKGNFKNCTNLTSISIPTSVTTIDDEAFFYCSSLESLEIPSSVTYIGSHAFHCCKKIESLEIPSSVTYIGPSTFYGCTNLRSISLGSSLNEIGNSALSACDNLSEITLFNTIPPSYLTDFTNKQYMDVTLKVPHGSLSAYQNADNWKKFWNITEMAASGISEIKTDYISILTDANSILITGAEAKDTVTIVGIDGNIRYSGYDRIISGLPAGLYIVKVRNCVRKVIIK